MQKRPLMLCSVRPGLPRVALLLVLLLAAGAAQAKGHDAARWLAKHPQVSARLQQRLGAEASAFVARVGAAELSWKSKQWLLRFAGEDVRAPAALGQLQRAHAMDPKMERALRSYADAFHEQGGVPESSPDAELQRAGARLRSQLSALERRGALPALIVMIDGPDGVGKSSTIRRVADALRGPYAVVDRVARLGAPDPQLPWAQWARQQLGALPGKGQLLLVDRSALGELVYGKDPREAAARVAAFEAQLAREGVLVRHVVQVPKRSRVRETYGKRLAYELFADTLAAPRPFVSPADVPAYARFKDVRARFTDAAAVFAHNTLLVDSTHRTAARLQVLQWLGQEIEAACRGSRCGVR